MRPYNGIFHNRTYTHILCGCTSSLSWISTPINIHFIANTMLENDSDGIKHMEYTYFSWTLDRYMITLKIALKLFFCAVAKSCARINGTMAGNARKMNENKKINLLYYKITFDYMTLNFMEVFFLLMITFNFNSFIFQRIVIIIIRQNSMPWVRSFC